MRELPGYLRVIVEENMELGALTSAPYVHMVSATYANPKGSDKNRFEGSLLTAETCRDADVPLVAMVGKPGFDVVAPALRTRGAHVVLKPRDGVYLPYADAMRLIIHFAGENVVVGKAEPEKPIFAWQATTDWVLRTMARVNMAVGVRSVGTWNSMPIVLQDTEDGFRRLCEALLPSIPRDVMSGVAFYGPGAHQFFLDYEKLSYGDNWLYLAVVPLMMLQAGRTVGDVLVEFLYQGSDAENNDVQMHLKRLRQFWLVSDGLLTLAGHHSDNPDDIRTQSAQRLAQLDQVVRQATNMAVH